MLANLKSQEDVDRLERLGIARRYFDSAAIFHFLVLVGDCLAEPLHRVNARWSLVVYKHRYREVAGREHSGDMHQVSPDLVPAGSIGGVIGYHFDRAALRQQPEVMSRLLLVESHTCVAALVHRIVIVMVAGLSLIDPRPFLILLVSLIGRIPRLRFMLLVHWTTD